MTHNKMQEDEQGKEYDSDDIDDNNSKYSTISSRRGTTVWVFGVKRIRCVVMALLAE